MSADIRAEIASATPQATFSQEITAYSGGNDTDTKAQREQLVLEILKMKKAVNILGYDQTPVMILHPSTWERLMTYITIDKELTVASVQASAFVDAQLSGIFGIDFIVDWGATINTKPNHNADSYVLIRGRTVTYAGQLSKVEQMRDVDRFATLWRALDTYGIHVQETRSLLKFAQTVAT